MGCACGLKHLICSMFGVLPSADNILKHFRFIRLVQMAPAEVVDSFRFPPYLQTCLQLGCRISAKIYSQHQSKVLSICHIGTLFLLKMPFYLLMMAKHVQRSECIDKAAIWYTECQMFTIFPTNIQGVSANASRNFPANTTNRTGKNLFCVTHCRGIYLMRCRTVSIIQWLFNFYNFLFNRLKRCKCSGGIVSCTTTEIQRHRKVHFQLHI